ncbi:MAG: hypothetical protein HYZ61_00195 [Candidatus Andersenbacteria bacterium]|nr:hypothetical protein [Candidatus Andersenbacteria bacterium]
MVLVNCNLEGHMDTPANSAMFWIFVLFTSLGAGGLGAVIATIPIAKSRSVHIILGLGSVLFALIFAGPNGRIILQAINEPNGLPFEEHHLRADGTVYRLTTISRGADSGKMKALNLYYLSTESQYHEGDDTRVYTLTFVPPGEFQVRRDDNGEIVPFISIEPPLETPVPEKRPNSEPQKPASARSVAHR